MTSILFGKEVWLQSHSQLEGCPGSPHASYKIEFGKVQSHQRHKLGVPTCAQVIMRFATFWLSINSHYKIELYACCSKILTHFEHQGLKQVAKALAFERLGNVRSNWVHLDRVNIKYIFNLCAY